MKVTCTQFERVEVVFTEREREKANKLTEHGRLVRAGPYITGRSFPRSVRGKFQTVVEREISGKPPKDAPRTPTPCTDELVAEFARLRSSTLSYPCEQRLLAHARALEAAMRQTISRAAGGVSPFGQWTLQPMLQALGETDAKTKVPLRHTPTLQIDSVRMRRLAPYAMKLLQRSGDAGGPAIYDLEYRRDGNVYTATAVGLKSRGAPVECLPEPEVRSLNRYLRKCRQPDPS